MTGLARTIGRLRLEAEEAKPRRGRPPLAASENNVIVRDLRAQLVEARDSETKALLLLSEAKKRAHIAEEKLSGAFQRLAKYERGEAKVEADQSEVLAAYKDDLAKAQEQAAEYKRHVQRLEAEARGKDQRISDLQRQVAQRVEAPAPVQAECPVCTAIKLMVLGVQHVEPKPKKPKAARGGRSPTTRTVVIAVLEKAERPMTSEAIVQASGLSPDQVYQTLWKAMRLDPSPVMRVGIRGNANISDSGYAYWLADRPLPEWFTRHQGASA